MNILHNLRHGFRLWVRNPGFTAIAALTVALGVGPNVAIFSAIWGIFLAPLPYQDANQLVVVWTKINGERNPSPADDYLQYLAQSQSFQELAFLGWQPATFNSNDPSEEPVPGNPVTAGYISKYLGYRLAMGRDFLREETTPGHDQVVVLGHRFWVERFHSDPNILGKQISIDGKPHTIVGVQRPGGSDRQGARFQVPLVLNPAGHNSQYGNIFGRLKPGVTAAQAQAELTVINQRLAATRPMAYTNSSIGVEQMRNDWLDKKVARTLWLLLAAVGFVLLIACANLANLLLGRGTSRRREIAVRGAIGASRRQVFAQLLVESLALSILGCAIGIGFAWALIKLVIAIQPGFLEQVTEANIELNIPVLLFAISIAIVSGILSGCAPAWRASRLNLTETLNQGSQSVIGGRRGRTQAILVITEFALAITLLSGAGMAMHSFWKLATIDLGFRPDHVLETELRVADPKDHNAEQMIAEGRHILEELRSIPGVQNATLTTGLPLSGASSFPFTIAGRPTAEKDRPVADLESVTPSFFTTFEIRPMRGRLLDDNDTPASTPVVVVNEAFVRVFLRGVDPLSQRLQIMKLTPDPKNPGALIGGPPVERQIVGVFRDVRNQGQLTNDVAPEMCIPYWQAPWPYMAAAVKTALDPALMTKALRGAIVSSGRTPSQIDILKQRVQDQRKGERFGTVLFGAFASLALLLAGVGIYGVMAFAVAQRGHEVGLRMALGAQQEEVLRLILKDGMRLGLYGAAIGVVGVYALGRVMRSTLYGVHTVDPLSLGIVAAVLFTAAFFACYIPARRAAKVDPMVALRYE